MLPLHQGVIRSPVSRDPAYLLIIALLSLFRSFSFLDGDSQKAHPSVGLQSVIYVEWTPIRLVGGLIAELATPRGTRSSTRWCARFQSV